MISRIYEITMKNGIVAAAIILAFLCGCTKADGKRNQPAKTTDEKQQTSQQPYYYGLIEEYRTMLAEDPHNRAATIALGNAFFDSGSWKEAITYYERALRLEPHDPDILTDLGTCYRNISMPDRATELYRRALQYSPGHLNARYNLGVVYAYDKKDYASAVREWEELLRIAPGFHQADMMRQAIRSFKAQMAGKGEK
jgi:cytochrome c-type biogenesis protein CcmH/NrfG